MEPQSFAIAATLIYLSGHLFYNSAIIRKEKEPDLVPWMIWGIMATLNALTYSDIAKSQVQTLLVRANSAAAILTLIIAIAVGGRMKGFKLRDGAVLAMGLIAIFVWRISDPFMGNIFVLVGVTIACEPIWHRLRMNHRTQKPLPWFLWTVGLSINLLVVYLDHGKPEAYIQPSVYVLLHGATWLMTLRQF